MEGTAQPLPHFKTSPDVIRLAVIMYIRFPLSFRNVEDLLHEHGFEVSCQARGSSRTASVYCSPPNGPGCAFKTDKRYKLMRYAKNWFDHGRISSANTTPV